MAYPNQNEGGSTMDKMKKMLSSPMSKRKNSTQSSGQFSNSTTNGITPSQARALAVRYFGVTLNDIVRRESTTCSTEIPRLISKVCTYIKKHGIQQEGIFRVSGNAKIVERLKASFDKVGDANLDMAGDVMAVAGLLKLFLRELPEGLISEETTKSFIRVQEEYARDKDGYIQQLQLLLRKLPRCNYMLLRYLCEFLTVVTKNEADNKMSAMALGIVFGPNLFRCEVGIQGLKDQGVTNHITVRFIQDFSSIFVDEQPFPIVQNGKRKAPAPPRPPPPNREDVPTTPVTTNTRKGKQKYDSSPYQDSEDTASFQSSETRTHHSDDEFLESGRYSPFPLETDRSEYSNHTALLNESSVEVVEKAIHSAISTHIFGGENTSTSSEEVPVRPPRRKHKTREDSMDDSFELAQADVSMEEMQPSQTMKQRIELFESSGQQPQQPGTNISTGSPDTRKQRKLQSDAFHLFEKKGLVIGPAPSNLLQTLAKHDPDHVEVEVLSDNSQHFVDEHKPQAKPRPVKRSHESRDVPIHENEDSALNSVHREEATLTSFKKPAGPKNRRNPTRRSSKGPDSPEFLQQQDVPVPQARTRAFLSEKQNSQKPAYQGSYQNDNHHTEGHSEDDQYHNNSSQNNQNNGPDMNHNTPSTKFLNIHFNGNRGGSPEKSPVVDKPFIPPLDLSILHQHGDGSEPIALQPTKPEDTAMISPRSDSMHKASHSTVFRFDHHKSLLLAGTYRMFPFGRAQRDPEIPPSPPMEQTVQKRVHRVDEDFSQQIKQLTKKIQTCKRKIKLFEENFEVQQGYRPSQTDKAAQPDIKKCMQDLAKTRKELRKVKEDQDQQRLVASPGSSAGEGPPSMKETLHASLKRLTEKRTEARRPEDLEEMTSEHIQEEKLAVQKALLHFENIHGRPTTKAEKELMRPLYDRYRNIKRAITKRPFPPTDKGKDSLQTVPEDHTIEFEAQSAQSTFSNRKDPIRIPTAEPNEEERDAFMVTRDFRLLADTVKAPGNTPTTTLGGEESKKGGWVGEPYKENIIHSPPGGEENHRNLHEMNVSELLEEQTRIKNEKKRLRKILREFEDDFYEQHGFKVQKEDRSPMHSEYHEYKQIKARLKLLEALLSKHGVGPDL